MLPNLGRWSVSSGSVRTTYTDEVTKYGVHIELSRAVFEPSLKSAYGGINRTYRVAADGLHPHFVPTLSDFVLVLEPQRLIIYFSSKCADNQSPTPQPVGTKKEAIYKYQSIMSQQ